MDVTVGDEMIFNMWLMKDSFVNAWPQYVWHKRWLRVSYLKYYFSWLVIAVLEKFKNTEKYQAGKKKPMIFQG